MESKTVLYADSAGNVEDARQWVIDNGYDFATVRMMRIDSMIVVEVR